MVNGSDGRLTLRSGLLGPAGLVWGRLPPGLAGLDCEGSGSHE